MSSSPRRSRASKFTEDEINDLVSKLQALLPQLNQRNNSRISASKILNEACSYIMRLQKEVEDLSERLSGLMASAEDISDIDVETLRRSLQQ